MKKRYLAMLLAFSMVMCSGCSLPFVTDNVNIEDEEDRDGKNDKDDKDGEDNGGSVDGINPSANGGSDEDDGEECTVTAGPEYIIGHYEEEIGGYDEGAIVQIKADRLLLLDNSNPDLVMTVENINRQCYESTIERWDYQEYVDSYGAEPESTGQIWSDEKYISVTRNDSQMLSVNVIHDSYVGGAHPYSETYSYNIEPETGYVLALDAVVNDYNALYDYVHGYLNVLNEGNLDESQGMSCAGMLYPEWEDTLREFFFERECVNWLGREDGIMIYFNGYDIAPWAAGPVQIEIDLKNNPDLLNPDYFHKDKVEPVKGQEWAYTEVVERVVRPLSQKLGVWNYDDCIEYVNGTGVEYACEEPYECESSGDIMIDDPVTDYRMWLLFWSLDPDSTVYSKETDALSRVNYVNEDYNFSIDNYYNEGEVSYSLIDYNIHNELIFDTEEDFWNYLGFYFSN